MRCPKCSYLSYDEVERCRNCGYDFALVASARDLDAPAPVDPSHEPRAWEPTRRRRPGPLDTTPPPEGAALDLPLFEDSSAPEPPPVAIPPAGPPLSVRRKVEIRKPPARIDAAAAVADAPPGDAPAFEWPEDLAPTLPIAVPPTQDGDPVLESDGIGARLRAGIVDGVLLLAIDAIVVWLTLRVAGVELPQWRLLPLVPLIGFLFLLDTAYLVTFTAASGQTIGKMLSGVRVVYGEHARVPFGHAVLRSVALLVCVLPLGLGLLPMFLDATRRGPHDRLAGTRVVPSA